MTAGRGYEQKLAALSAKAVRNLPSTTNTLHWDRPAAPPYWMPNQIAIKAISQFHYGEIATARICDDIRARILSPAARGCLEAQADDERRHAHHYRRYLEKLGGMDHRPSAIKTLYEKATSWSGAPEGVILACHTIFEGESLQLQKYIDTWMPCPLFKDISAVIARDEARHVAFGRIYLQEALPHLPYGERLSLFCWIRALWFETVRKAVEQFAPPGLFALHGGKERWIGKEWRERLDMLEALHLFAPEERRVFLGS